MRVCEGQGRAEMDGNGLGGAGVGEGRGDYAVRERRAAVCLAEVHIPVPRSSFVRCSGFWRRVFVKQGQALYPRATTTSEPKGKV